ncbi:MAG: hypothetical protein LC664_07785, partial [Flavobacteriales bacterium]|nr:hypothetical protein [Flavobacteriales bacterium]
MASATESPANRFQIGPNAEQLLHVKIEIQDCSELPDLSFDLLGDMLNFSFYAETATGLNFNFNNITASDTENGSMCGMSISNFSPQVVNGGVGDMVTINGINFGTTPGTVKMKNADDGGETWVDLDDYDILWSPSQIDVRVPSIIPLQATNENQLKVPGSGKIKIITADNDNDETNSELIINYSWRNYNAPTSNLKGQAVLAGRDPVFDEDTQNQEPGYRFIPHPNIANNGDAMQS